jgi:sugar phosphate isomerase/epimerase
VKLAVSNIAFAPQDRSDAYAMLHDAGITGLEIAPRLFFHSAEDPFQPDAISVNTALDEIADMGLTLVSMQSLLYGLQGAALFGDAYAHGLFMSGMLRAISLAERLCIPNLVFGSPGQRIVPSAMQPADALALATEVFRELGDAAVRAGTVLSVEANPTVYGTNFLNSFAEADAFVAKVDHPGVTLILDIGAMHINNDFDALPQAVSTAGKRISHVHISEPNLAPAPNDLSQAQLVLNCLHNLGYDGAVSIEMKSAGLDVLNSAVKRLVAAQKLRERT